MTAIPYAEQLREVRRELVMRERNYPRWVAAGKMTQAAATRQIETMRAVEHTIAEMAKGEELAL